MVLGESLQEKMEDGTWCVSSRLRKMEDGTQCENDERWKMVKKSPKTGDGKMKKVVSTVPQSKLGNLKIIVSGKQFGYFQTTLMFSDQSECDQTLNSLKLY